MLGWTAIAALGHILELAFGANMTYALLLHIGVFESQLEEHLDTLHKEVSTARQLLVTEDTANEILVIDHNKTRCKNMIKESVTHILARARVFTQFALASAFACLVLLLIGAMSPNLAIPNATLILLVALLFGPVPIGLTMVNKVIANTKSQMTTDYDSYFNAINLLKNKPRDETLAELNVIRARMNKRKSSTFSLTIFGNDK
ncbi:MAG TPA: hypothetical protein VHZ78_03245 [Rhizomicrobium sp.]|jgi:hypothetical protein|nr:hypothetical protein [Rhizomicrobium sp.]